MSFGMDISAEDDVNPCRAEIGEPLLVLVLGLSPALGEDGQENFPFQVLRGVVDCCFRHLDNTDARRQSGGGWPLKSSGILSQGGMGNARKTLHEQERGDNRCG